jgi:hypothetical protein
MKTPLISLISLILVGCAATPPHTPDAGAANGSPTTLIDLSGGGTVPVGTVAVDLDGTLPAQASTDAKLAGRISLTATEPLRYSVDYALTPGDVLAHPTPEAATAGLTRIGSQAFGHSLELQTPTVLGAPVAVRLRSESVDDWTISGHNREQRALAALSWAPHGAALNMQWLDMAPAADPSLALGCGVLGSLQLPANGEAGGSTRALDVSGNYCKVLTDDSRFAALDAHTWRVTRVWRGEAQESSLALSMIAPVWKGATVESSDIEPSYQLGWQMRRSYRAWSAAAGASLRDRGTWNGAELTGPLAETNALGLGYATDATLTRRFGDALVSTTWARGSNPLWFLPDSSGSTDRFDVSLDVSRWAQYLLPSMTPRLGLSWNRWETRSSLGSATGDRALMLQFAMTL